MHQWTGGVSRVNSSKCTPKGPSILASASLVLTRNTIFAGTRQTGATNNFAQQAIYRSTHVQSTGSDSHQICLPVFSPQAYRNIHSIKILVHRTAHMWNWKWFHGLWRKRTALRMWPNRRTEKTQTPLHFKTQLRPAAMPSNNIGTMIRSNQTG